MNFEMHDSANDVCWKRYRYLELVPVTVPNPACYGNLLKSGLNLLWRPLLAVLIDELVEEQRVEYLHRCWSLNEYGQGISSAHPLQRLWTLIE